jgi:hypothetical protein
MWQQFNYCCPITIETVFSLGSDPRLYNLNPRPAEIELRKYPEMAEDDD